MRDGQGRYDTGLGTESRISRLRVDIEGAVQGVGFRPFVYRLATSLGLTGWVNNSPEGVSIEIEGPPGELDMFLVRLSKDRPIHSIIQDQNVRVIAPTGSDHFEILQSAESGEKLTLVLPDIATCSDCLRELLDPGNRRYRYPFTNCTNCGPRYSIIEALPYDRPNTTMTHFPMCAECQSEYDNPRDRRFHAQPNACTLCGPHLELWDRTGNVLSSHDSALKDACDAIRKGSLLAVKGLGGFHLMADARNDEAVTLLRQRKHRDEKPFALMYPSMDEIELDCEATGLSRRLLLSSEAPIVLVMRRFPDPRRLSPAVAPHNPCLGIMLPYTPLHHLMMADLGFPVVATSGNIADEPICTDNAEALNRLGQIADLFLVHNRPIHTHLDDSVVRVVAGREMILRRARGYAPLPIRMERRLPSGIAFGGHQKNTVSLATGKLIFISQHIGDLDTRPSLETFDAVRDSLSRLYQLKPLYAARDMHPDYPSSHRAESLNLRTVQVQHHHAHILACMADNEIDGPVLGVSWDGTGYGPDGTVWGGEFLKVNGNAFTRAAHFRTFPLPGGETAVREPRRSALGLLWELTGGDSTRVRELLPPGIFGDSELDIVLQALKTRLNCPVTSSAGRLFDAAASLAGLCQMSNYEGQAAMMLEYRTDKTVTNSSYGFRLVESDSTIVVDWEMMVRRMIDDLRQSGNARLAATKFHNTMADIIVAVATTLGEDRVVLSGGCFQNKYLTETSVERLGSAGFSPFWHRRLPPNDGGLSVGQIIAAGETIAKEQTHVSRGAR